MKGAPALNKATEAMLAFGNLTWDDVTPVEVSGYGASVTAMVEDRLDHIIAHSNSPPLLSVETSPRGIRIMRFDHDDTEGWNRMLEMTPWYFRHIATEGVGLEPGGQEVVQTAYPVLATMADQDEGTVYGMTRAMYEYYPGYKDSAPGADGWARENQKLDSGLLPYHEGAVRYYRDAGMWDEAAQETQDENLRRYELLASTWESYTAEADESAPEAFAEGWAEARYKALEDAELVTIVHDWQVTSP